MSKNETNVITHNQLNQEIDFQAEEIDSDRTQEIIDFLSFDLTAEEEDSFTYKMAKQVASEWDYYADEWGEVTLDEFKEVENNTAFDITQLLHQTCYTKEAQEYILKNYPEYLSYFYTLDASITLSPEIQIQAVKEDPSSLRLILNPTDEVKEYLGK